MADGSPARSTVSNQPWLITLLPAFPLILLVFRLWYLSRQDVPTMLLLLQNVNPLGLVGALATTLIWVLPAAILVGRALGALLRVSAPSVADAERSLLARLVPRTPDWVVVLAVMLSALVWQVRYLPLLLTLAVSILGLTVRERYPGRRRVRVTGLVVPLVAGAASTAVMAPAGWTAARLAHAGELREAETAALLLVPPMLSVLLTGPVPRPVARLVTHWTALVAAMVAPLAIGVMFLHTPVLPLVAVETDAGDAAGSVVRGYVIVVDDRNTTLLGLDGRVRFIANTAIRTQVLCAQQPAVPSSTVTVYGWSVEKSSLEWIAPNRPATAFDPRCLGRP